MMASKTKVLIVDDDPQFVCDAKAHIERLGYEVTTAADGTSALKLAQSVAPDVIVLDINFPESKTSKRRTLDGIEVLRRLREADNVPILMLSTTNISAVKVMALSLGADDYMSKPVEYEELGARIQAILRRAGHELPWEKALCFQCLRLDPSERRVWKHGEPIDLTGIEFDILHTMARRPKHVFTRDKLIEGAWPGDTFCVPKAVDVHIGHIRKKIEDDPLCPAFIVTVRGTGYRFEDAPA